MTIPRLSGKRVGLREPQISDLDRHLEVVGDPRVQEHYPFEETLDRYGAWRQLCELAGHWQLRGYGHWVMFVKGDPDEALIGDVGFVSLPGWPELDGEIEVGWTLRYDAWGHGYATDGAMVALDWAWRTISPSRVISVIPSENQRSKRVAARLGLSHRSMLDMRGQRHDLWAIDNSG